MFWVYFTLVTDPFSLQELEDDLSQIHEITAGTVSGSEVHKNLCLSKTAASKLVHIQPLKMHQTYVLWETQEKLMYN